MLNSSRGWLMFLALLVLLGYAEWQLAPTPVAQKKMKLAEETWELPKLPESPTNQALAILGKKSLWGKLPEKEALAAAPANPAWRIVGIAANGAERFVLIKKDGQPEQSLRAGDVMPGGSKILNIEQDRICLLINGKKRMLGIYKTGPQTL